MNNERQLDHWWETHGKPSLMEFFNKETMSSSKIAQNGSISNPPSQFNLSAIKWKRGRGQDRRDATPDEPGYAFVTDTRGEIYPETRALYDEVCRYGTVHTEGWEITTFGDRTKMLSKRRPKE